RNISHVAFKAPGADCELSGVYFADDGQYFEQRLLVDHSEANCRSNVMYKGALQGDPNSDLPETRTAWVGDALIRAQADNTDTYEKNMNLVLSEGARADAVPNLEIATGEIIGAGHAATVGRFDDEQLYYLMSRGIPEPVARRLIVHGFFTEVISRIPIPAVQDELEKRVSEELDTVSLDELNSLS
ncbi:MAG: SufD family Fe-S cluster assembly protein, partial [Corynebacterium kroppenstedtii]|nr:SufD family Fe-S cluster assembly protein [Corynebacterium kroppenstedtii]